MSQLPNGSPSRLDRPDHASQPSSHDQLADQSYASGASAAGDASQEISEDGWRQLANLVKDVGPTLTADEELGDIAAAEEVVIKKDKEREDEVDRIQTALRALTTQHKQATAAALRPVGTPSPHEHDAEVRRLEQEQYSAGKRLNEEQVGMGKKEVELSKWKNEKEEVGKWEVGDKDSYDGGIIRLKLFTEMGFNLLPNEGAGDVVKMIVRNDANSDVHPVSVERTRSKAYYANLLWGLATD